VNATPRTRRRAAVLVAYSALILGACSAKTDDDTTVTTARVVGIGALGTLEPSTRIHTLSAPGSAPRLAELLVSEGQDVVAGQVLARTDEHDLRLAEVARADGEVEIARARLAQTVAGAEPNEIAALEAALRGAGSERDQSRIDLARQQALAETNTVSAETIERQRLALATAEARVDEFAARLAALRVIRDVDVAVRESELQLAEAAAGVARAACERTLVRAPFLGRVLRIRARAGESVTTGGILELGDVSVMHAVAEVYEADIARVQIGAQATVGLEGLDLEFTDARVVAIGSAVGRKVALDNDPVTDTDARVVEVRVELDARASALVAGLSNARVKVLIKAQP